MATRPHFFAFSFGFAFSCSILSIAPRSLATVAVGTEEEAVDSTPQVENAKYHFAGRVTNNNVFVKAGPSLNSYSTMKLDKDAEVTVVGIKGEWLKIIPPTGSFSYVPQVYVTRRGDGSTGRVNSTLNVRAGSSLNGIKTTIQAKLEEGQDVKILGDQDEYYKIAPPEGAYVYINKQYVAPERKLGEPAIAKKTQQDAPPIEVADVSKGQNESPTTKGSGGDDVSVTQVPEAKAGASRGKELAKGDAEPTTKPAATAAIEDFVRLESEFAAASKQPVVDQPIEQLTEKYSALANADGLSGANKRVVNARLVALKMRGEARGELQTFQKGREEIAKRQQSLVAEQGELDARLKQTEVSLFTAVGTLRMSSLQLGSTPLYRLTDPATGRTVVYIRSGDAKYAGMLNQFVGVRGDMTSDERMKMKIITPTAVEPVDASKVNGTIIATLTPPSMLSATATVDPHEPSN